MGDIFHKEQRGRAMALYSFVAMLGPVLGPVCAGWYVCIFSLLKGYRRMLGPKRITQRTSWRWVVSELVLVCPFYILTLCKFWSISLVDVIVQISGIFLLRESKCNCEIFFTVSLDSIILWQHIHLSFSSRRLKS